MIIEVWECRHRHVTQPLRPNPTRIFTEHDHTINSRQRCHLCTAVPFGTAFPKLRCLCHQVYFLCHENWRRRMIASPCTNPSAPSKPHPSVRTVIGCQSAPNNMAGASLRFLQQGWGCVVSPLLYEVGRNSRCHIELMYSQPVLQSRSTRL